MSWDVSLGVEVDGQLVEISDTWRNYTHNCNRMIRDAGLTEWPYSVHGWAASTLGERLSAALDVLRSDPDKYRAMDPENGWGSYDTLVPLLEQVVESCRQYPSARVQMSA